MKYMSYMSILVSISTILIAQVARSERIWTYSPSPRDIQNGVTLVPLRALSENLGATVQYDAKRQLTTITLGNRTITVTNGLSFAYVNGSAVHIDAPVCKHHGVTFVPLRFIGESLGCRIEWNKQSQIVTVHYQVVGQQHALPPSSTPAPMPTTTWAPATETVRHGNVQLKIYGVHVGKMSLVDMMGNTSHTSDDVTIIALTITNISSHKDIDYTSWQSSTLNTSKESATLTDDQGNNYPLYNLGFGMKTISGLDTRGTISLDPGGARFEVLVFEKLVHQIKWLHLELPASNVGGSGMFRIEIPSYIIK